MFHENLILSSVADGVATIAFNRPEKLNALTPAMLSQFFAKVDAAAADPGVRVILITGTGRGFSAGLDLDVIKSGSVNGTAPERAGERGSVQWDDHVGPSLHRFFSHGWSALIASRKPTIAAINGPAFGWGLILALHCDIRFAARSAVLNATFSRLGVPAEKGVAWLMARLVGTARAADILYSARRIDSAEAERLGLVNAVLDDDQLMAHANAYARAIAANAAPRALAAIKAQIWTAIEDSYDQAFAAADREQDLCAQTGDFKEGLASYLEKRSPRFQGR